MARSLSKNKASVSEYVRGIGRLLLIYLGFFLIFAVAVVAGCVIMRLIL